MKTIATVIFCIALEWIISDKPKIQINWLE